MAKKMPKTEFDPEPKTHQVLKITIVAVLLLAAAGAASYFAISQHARKKAEKAKTETAAQSSAVDSYKQQLPTLEKKARENPGDKTSIRDYAVALYATGDAEKAKEQYLSELKLNDKDPVLHNNLGNIYRDGGQYEEAIKAYQKAIELNPNSTTAYINLAHLYIYTLDEPDLGIDVYQEAIDANPENLDLKVLLGAVYEQLGKKEEAREIFESVLESNPANPAAKAGLMRVNN